MESVHLNGPPEDREEPGRGCPGCSARVLSVSLWARAQSTRFHLSEKDLGRALGSDLLLYLEFLLSATTGLSIKHHFAVGVGEQKWASTAK